jgi:hypothetical protein
VLCFILATAAGVPALEPPSGVIFPVISGPVRRLQPCPPVDPRDRHVPSHCWCSVCRSSTLLDHRPALLLEGRSPFSPDRGHIHHRMLDLGMSHRQTVFIYGIRPLPPAALLLSASAASLPRVFLAFGLIFRPRPCDGRRSSRRTPTTRIRTPGTRGRTHPPSRERGVLSPVVPMAGRCGAVRWGRGRWAPFGLAASIRCPYYGRGTEVLLGDP